MGQVWRYSGPAAAHAGAEWRILCHDSVLCHEDRNSNPASALLESLSPVVDAYRRKGRVKVLLVHLVYDSYWSPT